MKILIITNIRSGGTALLGYIKPFIPNICEDPSINTHDVLDDIYKNHDVIKLSISAFTSSEYINILKYLVNKYELKIIVLIRNNYKCALSIIKSQIINKYTNGYKISYDLSYDKNIIPFKIDINNVIHESKKILEKYSKIKTFLDNNKIKYMAIRFEWLFDKVLAEEKYNRIYIVLRYLGTNVSLKTVKETKLDHLFTESQVIYDKYCENYTELSENISKFTDHNMPFCIETYSAFFK